MKRPDAVTAIAVLLLVLVLAGGALSYAAIGEYGAEGVSTATGAISSSIVSQHEYGVIAIDNGTEAPCLSCIFS